MDPRQTPWERKNTSLEPSRVCKVQGTNHNIDVKLSVRPEASNLKAHLSDFIGTLKYQNLISVKHMMTHTLEEGDKSESS